MSETPQWWQRAERARRDKEQRLRHEAVQRLQRIAITARRESRRAAGRVPQPDRSAVLDSERLSAPFLERIGTRGRVQLLLWGGLTAVGACTIFSFFTTPLMELGTAMSMILVATMLVLSYVI